MKFDNSSWQISFSPQLAILWYSIIAGVLCAGLMTFVVLNIESQERAHIDRITQSTAGGIKSLLEEDIQKQLKLLNNLAKLHIMPLFTSPSSAASYAIPDDEWQDISEVLYDTKRGYQALLWVDNAFKLSKVTPVQNEAIGLNFALALKSSAHLAALKTARIDTATIAMQFIDKKRGFAIYVPVFKTTQSGKELEGYLGAVLSLDSYIGQVIPAYLLTEHQFTIFIDEQNIYSDFGNHPLIESSWIRQASFNMLGQDWRIELAPRNEFLSETHFYMMKVLILLGTLLSLFVAAAFYTAMFAANKEKLIKDSRNKTNQLLQNLPGMAYQALNKENWPMILVSEGCEKLTGYTKAEFEQHKVLWGTIIHPEDYDRVRQTISNAAINKQVFELEYRIKTQKNDIKLVWEKGEYVASTYNDEVIIEGFISDITSIKQVESDLIDSDAFSQTIVNSVVEAVITIDQKGSIKSFNNSAQKMFGYTFDEIKDKALKTLMPQPYEENHDEYLAQYLETKQAHIIGSGRELMAKRKDGTTFPIHLSVSEFQDHESTMFVGLIRDITQLRVSQNQARRHTEQLAHVDRLNVLGEMAASVAHEVNQPLTAISLYSQTAKNFCESGQFEKLPAMFEKMSQHARRAGAVLESVQMMTRQGERRKEVVSCQILIDEVIKLAESEARLRDIKIQTFVSNKLTKVSVDRVQIQQVVLNLLRNGMEAMQAVACKNGTTITIKAILNSDNYIEISIADTGGGLSTKMTNKLFTPFTSTKTNGTGIGLSISKRIVEEHGGRINFASNIPTGTKFFFTLPIHKQGVNNEALDENTNDA